MNDSHTVATIGFEGAPVALCVTRQRVIAGCNRAFGGLFGYRVDELVGHSMALLYPSRQEFYSIGRRGYPRMQQGRRYEDERLMRRRDDELIWCRVSGLTSKEIARLMSLSPRTVEMHRARLLRKLGVRTTPQLLAMLA